MAVTPNDVRHIAQLARLGVAEDRLPALVTQLNGILEHMQVLSEVNVPTDALSSDAGPGMPLRDDESNPIPLERGRDAFAPAMRDGFFLVPRLATHGASAGIGASANVASDADPGDEDEG